MSSVKFLTLNVRDLRNQEKRRSIFSYLKKQKANIYLLQETFSNLKDERIWSAEWGVKFFILMVQIIQRRLRAYKTEFT